MKSYRYSLFRNFAILFLCFSIVVIIFQYSRELRFKSESIKSNLDIYSEIISNNFSKSEITGRIDTLRLERVIESLPEQELRVTIVNLDGIVIYDSEADISVLGEHLSRREISLAISGEFGEAIRYSNSVNRQFFYYAKEFDGYFVRTALPYDTKTIDLLKVDDIFFYFMVGIFSLMLIFLILLSGQMNRSIAQLRDFADRAASNNELPQEIKFVENELGDISDQIVKLYRSSKRANRALVMEKEKLYKHLLVSQSGLAVFSVNKRELLSNQLFTMLLNKISDKAEPITEAAQLFGMAEFKPIINFIDNTIYGTVPLLDYSKESLEIEQNGHAVSVQAVIFSDQTFEIVIHDITEMQESKRLKQQLTGNIAHELKTPVAAVKGYLETVISNGEMDRELRVKFLKKAHSQTDRLTALIDDISTITKIEEARGLYAKTAVNIVNIVADAELSLERKIEAKGGSIAVNIPSDSTIMGNKLLLVSLFNNLFDNSLKYCDRGVSMEITQFKEDETHLYFSYRDDGPGVDDSKLPKLFDRFYRIDKGRSRKVGGTGLGLAIVKNAVLLHDGTITSKRSASGGLEFIFSFAKVNQNEP